jgi:hypothetical protein
MRTFRASPDDRSDGGIGDAVNDQSTRPTWATGEPLSL